MPLISSTDYLQLGLVEKRQWRDVTFDESGMLHSEKENLSPTSTQQVELESQVVPTKTVQKVDIPEMESDVVDTTSDLKEAQTSQPADSIATSRQQRVIRMPARYNDTVAYALPVIEGVPCTYKAAIWLHGLINDLGISQEHITVLCDSQSAICLAKNSVHHARTKHIDVRFHFIREILNEGDILLDKINTTDNPADMMTNVVSGIKFQHCLDLINISPQHGA
ncbi:uncharacterized protein LOC130794748 [Actinidia eriantha]|uniref:uncharacterized protein LOC130794748 n=1 Tax=Actinidia eriantha TaxID=165200 RepID=UPI002588D54F|nr:uncharacterized protein LOC130794748 [Actinidia eriantha]XP_057512687.1 uncharacterized protein LOC130794748 [Actinidia eriantha]